MANRIVGYENSPSQSMVPSPNEMQEELKERAGAIWKQATKWVVDNPEMALTAAVITGVLAGWLIKRR